MFKRKMMGGSVQVFPVERIENENIDLPADGKKRKYENSVPDLPADRSKGKEKSITVDAPVHTGEELGMKTDRELRAERRGNGEYTQARGKMMECFPKKNFLKRILGVRIENEKIDLPSDGKKRRKNQAADRKEKKKKEIIVDAQKTDRMLRAESREKEREKRERKDRQECRKKYKAVEILENNKIDLRVDSDPDLFARAGEEEEEDGIPIDAPVYTGEELDEVKDYFPKFDGVLPPWETRHGAGMDDKKQWPPIWKENFLESPEYQAFRDFLRYGRSDSTYRLICKEIRNSRGYDITHVDEYIPEEFHEMFLVEKCIAVGACKYVTDQINERAKDHGESYVFDEVKKAVRWKFPRAHYWYTFTVKQERPTSGNIKTVQAFVYCRSLHKVVVFLKEWRFKP